MRITIEGKEIKEGKIVNFLARHLKRFSVILSTGKVINICHYRSEHLICSNYRGILSKKEQKEYNEIVSILER